MRRLIDQYGRKIDYLRVSVTDRCNLRCVYCMPDSGIIPKRPEEILTYEEILRIVQTAVFCGINKIRITGGEPLVRKDIVYLIGALAKTKGIDDLSLTTNGILLNEYIEDLKRVGLKRTNISLDTLNRERYKIITGSDALNRVWEGISKALKIGLNPIKINVVIMKGINDDEIIEFAKLTLSNPFHIRFIEFMPIGNSNFWTEDKFISNNEVKDYCQNLEEMEEQKNYLNGNISSSYRFKGAKGTISFISPVSRPFCSKCSRLRLTSDGKLRLCLVSPEEIDLMPIVRPPVPDRFSPDNLREMFESAINSKPKGYYFNPVPFVKRNRDKIYNFPVEKRDGAMCQIGG